MRYFKAPFISSNFNLYCEGAWCRKKFGFYRHCYWRWRSNSWILRVQKQQINEGVRFILGGTIVCFSFDAFILGLLWKGCKLFILKMRFEFLFARYSLFLAVIIFWMLVVTFISSLVDYGIPTVGYYEYKNNKSMKG